MTKTDTKTQNPEGRTEMTQQIEASIDTSTLNDNELEHYNGERAALETQGFTGLQLEWGMAGFLTNNEVDAATDLDRRAFAIIKIAARFAIIAGFRIDEAETPHRLDLAEMTEQIKKMASVLGKHYIPGELPRENGNHTLGMQAIDIIEAAAKASVTEGEYYRISTCEEIKRMAWMAGGRLE